MLTNVLRRSLYVDWSIEWLRQHLACRPTGAAVDDLGRLVMELGQDHQDVVWAPDKLFKMLRQSEPTAATIHCCWRLCRHYDDWQETANAVTAAAQKQLGVNIRHCCWYWDDQHDVLLSTASIKGHAKQLISVKTKEITPTGAGAAEPPYYSVALLPSNWLHTCLLDHLETRAFTRKIDHE